MHESRGAIQNTTQFLMVGLLVMMAACTLQTGSFTPTPVMTISTANLATPTDKPSLVSTSTMAPATEQILPSATAAKAQVLSPTSTATTALMTPTYLPFIQRPFPPMTIFGVTVRSKAISQQNLLATAKFSLTRDEMSWRWEYVEPTPGAVTGKPLPVWKLA